MYTINITTRSSCVTRYHLGWVSWFNIWLSVSRQALYSGNIKNIHIQKTFCNLIRSRNYAPLVSTWVHSSFYFLFCLYVLSSVFLCPLRCPHKNYVRIYLRYLCLFAYSGVQHILCFSLSYVFYVASFSVLSFFNCPFGIL